MAEVQITNFAVDNWRGAGDTAYLWAVSEQQWTDADGDEHLEGSYDEFPLTVNTTTHRIDEQNFTLTSTLDALVNPGGAVYTLWLLDSKRSSSSKTLLAQNVWVPVENPPVMTWGALQLLGGIRTPWRDNLAPTRTEMQQYVQQQLIAVSGPDASVTTKGLAKASVAPALASNPIFVGDNDPRVAGGAGWRHLGTILEATLVTDEGNLGEPTIIERTDPQLLTGYSRVFACWHTAGWSDPNICYAESPDMLKWTRRTTPVVANACRGGVIKVGSNYHLFCSPGTGGGSIVHYNLGTTGLTPTLVGTVVSSGAGWKALRVDNSTPIVDDDGTWWLLYDGLGGDNIWRIGLASSTDGGSTWTDYTGNPVMNRAPDGVGQPDFHKVNGVYYAWPQAMPNGIIPSDVWRYAAPAPSGPWVSTPSPTFPRMTADEGVNSPTGQITGRLFEYGGQSFFVYTTTPNGLDPTGHSRIKLAFNPLPLAELVKTAEGVNPAYLGQGVASFTTELIDWTPVFSAASGVLGAVTILKAQYQIIHRRTCFVSLDFTINSNGTGSGTVRFTLPVIAALGFAQIIPGTEAATTGWNLRCSIGGGATYADITYDVGAAGARNVYPGANGARFLVTGTFITY